MHANDAYHCTATISLKREDDQTVPALPMLPTHCHYQTSLCHMCETSCPKQHAELSQQTRLPQFVARYPFQAWCAITSHQPANMPSNLTSDGLNTSPVRLAKELGLSSHRPVMLCSIWGVFCQQKFLASVCYAETCHSFVSGMLCARIVKKLCQSTRVSRCQPLCADDLQHQGLLWVL